MRTFIAVHFDEAIREKIFAAGASLRKFVASGKWVALENLHLTLKFLGEISEEELGQVKSLVRKCVEGTAPWQVKVRGLGAFPPGGTPRVLWAGIEDPRGNLSRIAANLNEALEGIVPKEARPFVPHITFARLKKVDDPSGLRREIDRNGHMEFGLHEITSIQLMKSQLSPGGPKYSVLERVELKAAP